MDTAITILENPWSLKPHTSNYRPDICCSSYRSIFLLSVASKNAWTSCPSITHTALHPLPMGVSTK